LAISVSADAGAFAKLEMAKGPLDPDEDLWTEIKLDEASTARQLPSSRRSAAFGYSSSTSLRAKMKNGLPMMLTIKSGSVA
jgi:hypothetical protein